MPTLRREIATTAVLATCLLLSCIVMAASDGLKHRIKRKVVFSKSSKFFFRLNGKDNVLNHTEIFAHGWAIRINYDLPESIPRRRHFFKRDVHSELEAVTDESGVEGFSCILKYLCDTVRNLQTSENCGILCGIGSIISRSVAGEASFFKSFLRKCEHHQKTCMYSFSDPYISNYG